MKRIASTAVVAVALLWAASCGSQDRTGTRTATEQAGDNVQEYNVTPVEGSSWVKHLGLPLSQTKMGQMGGLGPAPATRRREPPTAEGARSGGFNSVMRRMMSVVRSNPQQAARILQEPFTLTGADLYRLNCQSCHGPKGTGAPPEINSLIGPVQGTSPAMIEARMEKRGAPIGEEMAKQMADEAETELRDRLSKGGKKMPPFPHLRGDEGTALMGYLDQLAGVPRPAHAEPEVAETAARVGEHLVKGTCHVCHDATGPGGGHMAMMEGIIPSLTSMPQQLSLGAFLDQVHYGSPPMMRMMGRDLMPAMPYFTDNELAAAYFYLSQYPPRP
jgi:mono/diheme cytochrome c family protein